MPTSRLTFAPLQKMTFTRLEACEYLGLHIGREDNTDKQVEAIDRLVDERRTLFPCMYRRERMFLRTELDRFLESQQKKKT